ncbi:hypothetical protein [Streptomyces sp. NPDC059142]|uniref:hypothetical protein n=1 Tax=Streptomyces sp. NPDC059142 TaxID=3346739 RepID=UPI00367C9DB4
MPILKLRYQQTPNQAVQGTDVTAFRFRQTPPVIAVPEVKTRATRKRALGTEAHDSLEKVLVRLDESLHFALFRCAERDHQFLVRHLAALLRRPEERVVERHMVFVHEALVRKDDVVALLADVVTQRTKLTVVKISGLQDFVARVYRAAETGAGSRRTETDKGTTALRSYRWPPTGSPASRQPTFRQFLGWLSQLTTDEITTLTDPDTARRLIRSTEHRSPRATQATILSGAGTFTCPLRGVRHSGNDATLAQLPAGAPLDLVRDPGNETDPNAIQVQHQGVFIGCWDFSGTFGCINRQERETTERPFPQVSAP